MAQLGGLSSWGDTLGIDEISTSYITYVKVMIVVIMVAEKKKDNSRGTSIPFIILHF